MKVDEARVLFSIPNMGAGGAERVLSTISRGLSTARTDLAIHDDIRHYSHGGHLHVLETNFEGALIRKPIEAIRTIHKTGQLKRSLSPDISISFLFWANLANICTRRDEKVVLSVRTTLSRALQGEKTSLKLYRALVSEAFGEADAIVTLSRSVRRDLIENFGIAREIIWPIYNPIEVETVRDLSHSPLPDTCRWFFEEKPVILLCGRLVPAKGHTHFLRAFSRLKCKDQFRVAIVGDGPLKEDLHRQASESGLVSWHPADGPDVGDAHIGWLGFQPNPFPFYRSSFVFVFPSVLEGLGNVIIEALACECPVVAADCRSGPREILAPDSPISKVADESEFAEFGVLMPPFASGTSVSDPDILNSWIEFLDEELAGPRLSTYSERGHSRANDFAADKIVAQWDTFIEEVLNGRFPSSSDQLV